MRLERYERRLLSRRKYAIRAFSVLSRRSERRAHDNYPFDCSIWNYYLKLQIGRTKPNSRAESMRFSLPLTALTQTPTLSFAELGVHSDQFVPRSLPLLISSVAERPCRS